MKNVSVHPTCTTCDMKGLVTHTLTGALIAQPYYQCCADMTQECLGEDSMTIYEEESKDA